MLDLFMDTCPGSPLERETESLRLRSDRITQGVFRSSLLRLWGGTCLVSGVRDSAFLRASHIKPWASATNSERMDPWNGLLLAVNYDFAFDCGMVTFGDDGALVVHPDAPKDGLRAIGVDPNTVLRCGVDAMRAPYLAYHREHVFGVFSSRRGRNSL